MLYTVAFRVEDIENPALDDLTAFGCTSVEEIEAYVNARACAVEWESAAYIHAPVSHMTDEFMIGLAAVGFANSGRFATDCANPNYRRDYELMFHVFAIGENDEIEYWTSAPHTIRAEYAPGHGGRGKIRARVIA